jgi:hypothetical protein
MRLFRPYRAWTVVRHRSRGVAPGYSISPRCGWGKRASMLLNHGRDARATLEAATRRGEAGSFRQDLRDEPDRENPASCLPAVALAADFAEAATSPKTAGVLCGETCYSPRRARNSRRAVVAGGRLGLWSAAARRRFPWHGRPARDSNRSHGRPARASCSSRQKTFTPSSPRPWDLAHYPFDPKARRADPF